MNSSGAEPVDNSGGGNEKIFLSLKDYVRTDTDLPQPPPQPQAIFWHELQTPQPSALRLLAARAKESTFHRI
jgi:hypothetical protein